MAVADRPSLAVGRRLALLAARLVRFPADLVFLTWDLLRLAGWVLDNLVPWLSEDATAPYEPCLKAGVLDETREGTLWVLGLSRKYGTKRLLSLLLTDLRWHADADGRRHLCWCGSMDTPPTTPRRFVLAVLVLGCFWGVCAGIAFRHTQDLSPSEPSWARPDSVPEALAGGSTGGPAVGPGGSAGAAAPGS